MIINLTYSKLAENVVEIMFHCLNNDWFTVLFPEDKIKFNSIKEYYVGRDFYKTKHNYKSLIFEESDMLEI